MISYAIKDSADYVAYDIKQGDEILSEIITENILSLSDAMSIRIILDSLQRIADYSADIAEYTLNIVS